MDGWEAEDNPIEEHLKHSPSCGWAVTAAVEAECDGLEQVDPREARLLEARKATFAGRWPYESKKAWKCKTKQVRLCSNSSCGLVMYIVANGHPTTLSSLKPGGFTHQQTSRTTTPLAPTAS